MCDYCSWIDQILARLNAEAKLAEGKGPQTRVQPTVVVHGGVGKMQRNKRNLMLQGVKNAALEAYKSLIHGGSAINAVEIAICHMESDKNFNCAKGGCVDATGEVVSDAAIMNGDLSCGCAGAIRGAEHPITVAKKVLEVTEHVLIVENGIEKLMQRENIRILSPEFFISKPQRTPLHEICRGEGEECESVDENMEEGKTNEKETINDKEIPQPAAVPPARQCPPECVFALVEDEDQMEEAEGDSETEGSDTLEDEIPWDIDATTAVGAVAFDRKKRISCGTSYAGQTGKPRGSVSASTVIIGCGIYADERGCCSVSGSDRAIYAFAPARKIIRRLGTDTNIVLAVDTELDEFKKENCDSCIGAIALDAKGEPSVSFRSACFPWACCRNGYMYYGCRKKDKYSQRVQGLKRPLDCMCDEYA